MKRLPASLAVTLLLAGPVLAMERPPKPAHSAVDDQNCAWEWREGAGIGVWTEKCRLDTGLWEVTFDDKLQGFVLSVDGEDPMPVLQPFAKPKDADVSAVLPELVKRGYVAATECSFAPADTSYIPKPPPGQSFYEVVPTGERLKAFKALPNDEVPEPPCGDYGMAPDGIQYFMVEAAHPDRVIFVNLGQDGTMFDPKTITLE